MAHPDLDILLTALLEYAKPLVSKHGEFYPFGATMNFDDEVAYAGAYDVTSILNLKP